MLSDINPQALLDAISMPPSDKPLQKSITKNESYKPKPLMASGLFRRKTIEESKVDPNLLRRL